MQTNEEKVDFMEIDYIGKLTIIIGNIFYLVWMESDMYRNLRAGGAMRQNRQK